MSFKSKLRKKTNLEQRVTLQAKHDEKIEYFEHLLPSVKQIMIQEDYAVIQGGVILETNLGYIDASLSMKMNTIRAGLLGAVTY